MQVDGLNTDGWHWRWSDACGSGRVRSAERERLTERQENVSLWRLRSEVTWENGPLAQRFPGSCSHGRGHRFKPCRAHQAQRIYRFGAQRRLSADCQQITSCDRKNTLSADRLG
jgi:hypothetical protein